MPIHGDSPLLVFDDVVGNGAERTLLDEADLDRIKDAFDVETEAELLECLQGLARASFLEVARFIAGRDAPSTVDDTRQLRLYSLIRHCFGSWPSEYQIAKVFNITSGQAKGLLRKVRSRFQRRIQDIEYAHLSEVLEAARTDPESAGESTLVIASDVDLESLRALLRATDTPILKERNTAHTYRIGDSALAYLRSSVA